MVKNSVISMGHAVYRFLSYFYQKKRKGCLAIFHFLWAEALIPMTSVPFRVFSFGKNWGTCEVVVHLLIYTSVMTNVHTFISIKPYFHLTSYNCLAYSCENGNSSPRQVAKSLGDIYSFPWSCVTWMCDVMLIIINMTPPVSRQESKRGKRTKLFA